MAVSAWNSILAEFTLPSRALLLASPQSLNAAFHSLVRKFLEATLLVSVWFAYCLSPAFAVEVEHRHPSEGGHSHSWLDLWFDCHDLPCDGHDHHESPGDSQEGDDCSHSHVIFPGSGGHAAKWIRASFPAPPGGTLAPLTEIRLPCPVGPAYGVLKPPQLS